MVKRRQRSKLSKIMSNKDRTDGEWKFFVAWEAVNKDLSNHHLSENKGNEKHFFVQHGGNFEPPWHKKLWLTEFDMS